MRDCGSRLREKIQSNMKTLIYVKVYCTKMYYSLKLYTVLGTILGKKTNWIEWMKWSSSLSHNTNPCSHSFLRATWSLINKDDGGDGDGGMPQTRSSGRRTPCLLFLGWNISGLKYSGVKKLRYSLRWVKLWV